MCGWCGALFEVHRLALEDARGASIFVLQLLEQAFQQGRGGRKHGGRDDGGVLLVRYAYRRNAVKWETEICFSFILNKNATLGGETAKQPNTEIALRRTS